MRLMKHLTVLIKSNPDNPFEMQRYCERALANLESTPLPVSKEQQHQGFDFSPS